MSKFVALLFIIQITIITNANSATTRVYEAVGPQPTVLSPQGKVHKLYNSSHALLISASDYVSKDWGPLKWTATELDELASNLTRHGFRVTRVLDPTGDELFKVIKDFSVAYGADPDARLFIMFSGHGYTNPKTDMGYLVPIDAPSPSKFPNEFQRKALPIKQLELTALEIEARHAMFVFDSCFSGSIFARRNELTAPKDRGTTVDSRWRFLTEKAKEPVRQIITAGGPDETLPAKSIFVPLLLRALNGAGSAYLDGYVTGKEIGQWIKQILPSISRSQTPNSDVIRDVSSAFGGDMVFQIPKNITNEDTSVNVHPSIAEWSKSLKLPTKIDVEKADEKARKALEKTSFASPTTGYLLTKFDERKKTKDGKTDLGIEIGGVQGQPIRAVADGTVLYSGNTVSGFGELLILRHGDTRLISTYAHNSQRLVQEGQLVKKGQIIAKMGSSEAERPMLGFQIRQDGKNVDPFKFIPSITTK